MLKQTKGNRAYRIFDFLHRHIIIIIIAVVVLAGAVSTVTIVRGGGVSESRNTQQVEYQPMKTVYLAMDRVETLNPLVSSDSDVFYISQLVYSSLFRLDENLNIEPDLVKSYKTSPSEGSVSIKLRQDVKFSDGSSLTAADVSYTVNRILSIGSDSPYYAYVSKIRSVYTSGTYSLTITFESPADAALDNLVFPIVSRTDYSDSSNKVLGSGPYRFGSYDSTRELNLKPNKYYYGEAAQNNLQFKVVSDKSKTTGLMTMEAITAYVSRDQDADADAEDKDLQVTGISSGEMEYLAFNFKNKALEKKEVRQAIAKAIDTESLIKDNYGGAGIQSDSVYFPGFLGTENQGDAYALDQKKAAELMAEAGYRDTNEDGILEDEKGKKLTLTILVNRNNSSRTDSAGFISDALEEIGIKTTVKSLSWADYKQAIEDGEFDLYLGGYKFDKKSNLRTMFKSGNAISYKNTQVRSLVNQLETCLSAKKQKAVYEELKPLLSEELPYYCLLYKTYAFITVPQFTSEELPTFFDIYRGCGSWQWNKTVTIEAEDSETSESGEGAEKN